MRESKKRALYKNRKGGDQEKTAGGDEQSYGQRRRKRE